MRRLAKSISLTAMALLLWAGPFIGLGPQGDSLSLWAQSEEKPLTDGEKSKNENDENGPLVISPEETRIEQNLDGGYDLWVKAEEGLGSVLLTESTADPEKEASSYALRNPEYHPTNGDEKRMLDGEFLPAEEKELYSLIDSTPEKHPELGKAFHIFIPYVVEYGYSWAREGEIQILDGTWINIRAFEKKYASYQGAYRDNPFEIKVVQKPIEQAEEPTKDDYMGETVEAYEDLSEEGSGDTIYGKGGEDIIENVRDVVRNSGSKSIDLVLCLDTTESMHDDMPHLKKSLIPMLKEEVEGFDTFRLGMVLYRDYYESYLTRPVPFDTDFSSIKRVLDTVTVYGGRDIPEAVHEALYAGVTSFDWKAETRLLVLIGDAPPHPKPRGKVTKEIVVNEAKVRGIQIHTIILPH